MSENPFSHYRSSGGEDRDQKYDRRDVHRNEAPVDFVHRNEAPVDFVHRNEAPPQSDGRVSRPVDFVHDDMNGERESDREGRRYRPRSPSSGPRYQSRSTHQGERGSPRSTRPEIQKKYDVKKIWAQALSKEMA